MSSVANSPQRAISLHIPFHAMLKRWAPLPLRLIVGCGFLQHGIAKLSKGPDSFAVILHALSIPAPHLMAWLTITIEIFGGLFVLSGFLISIAALPMCAVLLAAMFTVHLPYGFSSIKLVSVTLGQAHFGPPGYECDLLYIACLLTLLLGGTGPLALDSIVHRKVVAD